MRAALPAAANIPAHAIHETKIIPPNIRPRRERIKPAVLSPPLNPAFFELLASTRPTIPRITETIADTPKNQNTTAIIPQTREPIAAPFPGRLREVSACLQVVC